MFKLKQIKFYPEIKRIFHRKSSMTSSISNLIDVHPQVNDALIQNKPIVALESTVITHGMPYPSNFHTALKLEDIVRNEGAIPATIAVIDGRIKIGLTKNQFEKLSTLGQDVAIKCSRRDLAYVTSKKLCGGTTVAGTMIAAKMAGIKVFSTGGIGGVHRNGDETFDISADLTELGRTSIAVISAGIKSILDIPKTLEYLETQGVCVVTYQCPERYFPAFYARSSGHKVSYNLNEPNEAAEMIYSALKLNLNSGILIAVPIPIENAISDDIINNAINTALMEAKQKNITGKSVTPFLLEEVSKITKGKSLQANIALLENNAKIASQISVNLSKLYSSENINSSLQKNVDDDEINFNKIKMNNENVIKMKNVKNNTNVPVIIGASILDIIMTIKDDELKLNGAMYDANSFASGGGVARNLAEGIYKLYGNVHFISAIGADEIGDKLKNILPCTCTKGVIRRKNSSSSICTVIIDKSGDCRIIFGDMGIHKFISPELMYKHENLISQSPLVIIDANIPVETMSTIFQMCKMYNKPVLFQPTDLSFANRPFLNLPRNETSIIKIISPNLSELYEICHALRLPIDNIPKPENIIKTRETVLMLAAKLLELASEYFDCIILTLGEYGVAISRRTNSKNVFFDKNMNYINYKGEIQYRHYEAPKIDSIINVSGAGDSFTSGFTSGILQRKSEIYAISLGRYAASKALKSFSAVPESYFEKDKNEENFKIEICKPKDLFEILNHFEKFEIN